VLSWADELAALEISAGLAISVLALVAVLPEYAVDFVWRPPLGSGERPAFEPAGRVVRRDRLGGLIHEYDYAA
jgi:hypothetical protein